MRRDNVPRIRALLKQYPQGLTARTIADALKIPRQSTRVALSFYIHEAYIHDWTPPQPGNNKRSAIWRLVAVPANKTYPKVGSKYDDGVKHQEPDFTLPQDSFSLTEDEINECWLKCNGLVKSNQGERLNFAREIEAKLKEKLHAIENKEATS